MLGYAELYDNAPVALGVVDADGAIVELNLTAAALFGVAREALVGVAFAAAARLKDGPRFSNLVGRSLRDRVRETVELPAWIGDGARVLEVTAAPLEQGDRPLCAVSIVDVTQRRHEQGVRDFLASATRQLASSLQAEEVAVRTAEMVVPRMADLCVIDLHDDDGWRRGDLRHRDPVREQELRRVGALPAGLHALARRAAEVGEVGSAADLDEYREVIAVPLLAAHRLFGVMTLAACPGRGLEVPAAKELARRVAAALNNAARHAEVVAADAAKARFLDQLSHELRTPLAAIYLWLHTARYSQSPVERERALDAIDRSARMQSRMVHDLVDLARAESGRLEVAFERITLAVAVESSLEAARAEAAVRGVELVFSAAPDAGDVWADRQRVGQIAAYLVAEALEPPCSGQVDVSVERDGDDACLIVKDGGGGLADEPQPFGTTISLALVKRLVALHGGSVRAESDGPGAGARYLVSFPRLAAPR